MTKFKHITFDHIRDAQNILRARVDGKPHLVYLGGWWWCVVGTRYENGVVMFGETPQIAYESALELQRLENDRTVIGELRQSEYRLWVDPNP